MVEGERRKILMYKIKLEAKIWNKCSALGKGKRFEMIDCKKKMIVTRWKRKVRFETFYKALKIREEEGPEGSLNSYFVFLTDIICS